QPAPRDASPGAPHRRRGGSCCCPRRPGGRHLDRRQGVRGAAKNRWIPPPTGATGVPADQWVPASVAALQPPRGAVPGGTWQHVPQLWVYTEPGPGGRAFYQGEGGVAVSYTGAPLPPGTPAYGPPVPVGASDSGRWGFDAGTGNWLYRQ